MQGEWQTSDLGTAAYAHSRGLAIKGARVEDGSGDFVFLFDDPEGRGPGLQIEFMNSDCRRFDESVRALKKLCYDNNARGGRRRR